MRAPPPSPVIPLASALAAGLVALAAPGCSPRSDSPAPDPEAAGHTAPPRDTPAPPPDPLGARDPGLQAALAALAAPLGIADLAARGRASLVLVDLADPGAPLHAALAPDSTLGAASVSKLAVLAAAFAAAEAGEIEITSDLRRALEGMIRDSSNPDATRAIRLLGFERIASALEDPRHRLHDAARGGGLWVGKEFPDGAVWRPEPCSGEAHAASAASVARFYVLLDRGELVSPEASAAMREILRVTTFDHKFVAGLRAAHGAPPPPAGQPVTVPGVTILRKSGSWGRWQADSALIAAPGRRYVLVCLLDDREGEGRLRRLAAAADRLMARRATERRAARGAGPPTELEHPQTARAAPYPPGGPP